MDISRIIRRFFRKLLCKHMVKDEVGYSQRRKVYQCLKCGKFFYSKY
jgi:hypothetical protein